MDDQADSAVAMKFKDSICSHTWFPNIVFDCTEVSTVAENNSEREIGTRVFTIRTRKIIVEYVLGQLWDDKDHLNDGDGDLSIELSAFISGHTRLASEILRYGGSVHRQIRLHRAILSHLDQLSDTKTISLWMTAVYATVSLGIRYTLENDEEISRGAVTLWGFFLQHIVSFLVAEEMRCAISIIAKQIVTSLSAICFHCYQDVTPHLPFRGA